MSLLATDMDSCGRCVKYTLLIINLIISILGLLIFAITVWIIADRSFISDLLGTNLYIGSAYVLAITSFLLVCVSFIGCYGSIKEIRCTLVGYITALFIITMTMFISAVLAFVFREKTELNLYNGMVTSLRFYDTHHSYNYAWTETQRRLMCCGVEGPANWHARLNDLPDSCCKPSGGRVQACHQVLHQNEFTLYQKGCLEVVKEYSKKNAMIVGVSGTILSALAVLAMIFSCILFKLIKYYD